MKIFINPLFIFFCLLSGVNAQDTIRTQDMPGVGSIYIMSIGQTFAGLDVAASGANTTWDFTQLGRSSQRKDTLIDPSQTDPLLSYFFINSPLNTNRSNLAQKGGNMALGSTGLNNVFNYYYNTQNSFTQVGLGASVNGLPLPMAFTPHDLIYKFPLTFEDEDSVSYTYQLDLTAMVGLYYRVKKKRHNLVDGWGNLSTPFGTFPALRVKSVVVQQDSVYIDTFNLGVNLPAVTTIEYKWLSPGKGLPLLQINTNATNQITQIIYQDSSRTIGVDEITGNISEAIVFPNPTSEKLFVKYTMIQKGPVIFRLFSSDGKEVFSFEEQSGYGEHIQSIDLSGYNLQAGNFFLSLQTGNSKIVKPVHIQ